MARSLIVYEIADGGGRTEIGKVEREEVVFGREPSRGITLNSHAVSREHMAIVSIRNHWFLKDLGSTNGTWINGQKLEKSDRKLVRSGDVVQVADKAIELVEVQGVSTPGAGLGLVGMQSLLVFSRSEFLDEYPIPDFGRALVIGGSKADLKLDVDVYELPSLVVERRGPSICAFTVATETKATHNNKELKHPVTLTDRDEVKVSPYTVVFSDPPGVRVEPVMTGDSQEQEGDLSNTPASGVLSGNGMQVPEPRYDDTPHRKPDVSVFGKMSDLDSESVTATQSFDRSEPGKQMHEALHGRRGGMEEEVDTSRSTIEDKLVLVVGGVLLMVLLGVGIWWLVSSS